MRAVRALVTIGDPAIAHVEPVYRKKADGVPTQNHAAAVLIFLAREAGSGAAVEVFVRAAQSPDAAVRARALKDLRSVGAGATSTLWVVDQCLTDPEPNVVQAAREARGALSPP
jgi:hypothetical protein